MAATTTMIPNLLKTLADALERLTDSEGLWNSVKIQTLVDAARNVAKEYSAIPDPSGTELDWANLLEGGTFTITLTSDRGKYYLEIADDWTGYIRKIFAAESLVDVVKAVSDKKDEVDLIYKMSQEPEEEEPNLDEKIESLASEPEEEGSKESEVDILEFPAISPKGLHFSTTKETDIPGQKIFKEKEHSPPDDLRNLNSPTEVFKKDELPGEQIFPDPKDARREG